MGEDERAGLPQASNDEALLTYLGACADELLAATQTLDPTDEAGARIALIDVLAFAEAFQNETARALCRTPALAATLREIAIRLDALALTGDAGEFAGRPITELRAMLESLTGREILRNRPIDE